MRQPAGPPVQMSEEELKAVTVGAVERLDGQVLLVDYDPSWPLLYQREEERIRAALGERVRLLEHVGSTSVPGLAAKPKIDILLALASSADEAAYVPAPAAAGYVLRIREPEWHEHRMFKGPDTDVNLHVYTEGDGEIARMLRFRDHLRENEADRRLYEETKRALAARSWAYVQNYADAKGEVVEQIIARAFGGASDSEG